MPAQKNSHERIDFIPHTDLKIVQSDLLFPFSIDSVLLARFAYVPIQRGLLADLCTGNGIVPLLLSRRSKAAIVGIELQEEVACLAERAVQMNHLTDQITVYCGDAKQFSDQIGRHQCDLVTVNPPYFSRNAARDMKLNPHLAIARHELTITLADVVRTASLLLKQNGKLALVHRPQRLVEILAEMRHEGIEPKRLQFVHPRQAKAANMVLVEGSKGGRPGLNILPPLFVHKEDGSYAEEVWTDP
ncbi:MAG: tRNA1(Val) (adenine(37)-N6)-methyltransferase [Sporolactobacillus sp.]